MNNIKTLTFYLLRTYATKYRSESAGVRGRIKLEKMTDNDFEDDAEDFNNDDTDVCESDFMNVGESYTIHEREIRKNKEILKKRIVRSKYFKEVEPKFLTFTEQDQIRKLHETNPKEWTPEKLSESFPALAGTIQKVLKANWVPKSVDRIIQYDSKVIENWKDFKAGRLVLNPILQNHLTKFRNRTITLTDREVLSEKFIPPKMEFPKPNSSIFSDIVKNYIEKEQSACDKTLMSSKTDVNGNQTKTDVTDRNDMKHSTVQRNKSDHIENNAQEFIKSENKTTSIDCIKQKLNELYATSPEKGITLLQTNNSSLIKNNAQKLNRDGKKITFNEYMKQELNELYKTSPEEGITLLQTYRKYIESTNSEDVKSNVLKNTTKQENKESNIAPTRTMSNENTPVVSKRETQSEVTVPINTVNNSNIDTFIKERKTDIDVKFEYVKPIRIPRNVWRRGMTYRIKDCYYDDDGQFLYRVPGLRS
ncbi:Neugrin [Dufourea novaeangliae]|uniref:Neugrin n=1 Tax=Dufourea novaeangliae TaxID=178035 RepID=A0A154PRB7_DUFNO|nr:Neugrin [Dufourea novaeangliae]